jgi:hypothetical protein
VAGRKRWLLLAPEQTHLLYDTHGRRLAPHFGREHYTAVSSQDCECECMHAQSRVDFIR